MKKLYIMGAVSVLAMAASAKASEGSGSKGKADKPDDDVQKVAIVQAPQDATVTTAGPALTPGQAAGLEPLDPEHNAEQAAHREHLTNMQTDHEAENALDPTSEGPTPGVTPNVAYTAAATGAPPSDMSGRPPLSESDKEMSRRLRDGLTSAKREDSEAGVEDKRQGWRTPQQLGIPGAVIERIKASGAPIDSETVPSGHHFPETGTRYRVR